MNYLPFDLEKALKNPERIVTVDGKEVKGFQDTRQYGNKDTLYFLHGFVDGCFDVWSLDLANEALRLKPETVEVTVYSYFNSETGKYWSSSDIEPSRVARSNTHIDTQTITVNKP